MTLLVIYGLIIWKSNFWYRVLILDFLLEVLDNKSLNPEVYDNKVIIKIKESFYILRNHNYMDKFYECLKKHNLYEECCEYSSDYYNYVFKERCKIHNINLKV